MTFNKLTLAAAALATTTIAIKTQSKDFLDDFVSFWEDDVGGVFNDIGDWFEGDFVDFWEDDFANFWTDDFVGFFEDVGDWFAGDFADWWEEDFANFWTDELPEFFEQEIPEILGLGPSDEDIEKMEKYNALLNKVKEQCAKVHPVGEPEPPTRWTVTNNFNYDYGRRLDLDMLYSLLGKEGSPAINERSCDEVDCLHPCYGENQLGTC